jgi:rhodanese-related sulfurtransferase
MQKKSSKQLVEEALSEIKTLSAAEAAALHGREDVVFVDLRDPREIEREGQIPGAFHCPRGMLEFWIDRESPYFKPVFGGDKQYIFYCASGWRSALATKTAQDMTSLDVCHIGGGFTAWRAGNRPSAKSG